MIKKDKDEESRWGWVDCIGDAIAAIVGALLGDL